MYADTRILCGWDTLGSLHPKFSKSPKLSLKLSLFGSQTAITLGGGPPGGAGLPWENLQRSPPHWHRGPKGNPVNIRMWISINTYYLHVHMDIHAYVHVNLYEYVRAGAFVYDYRCYCICIDIQIYTYVYLYSEINANANIKHNKHIVCICLSTKCVS